MTEALKHPTERQERRRRRRSRVLRSINMWFYRKSNGRIGGQVPNSHARICLLTTTGRRSGMAHTVPLVFLEDGNNVVLVAAMSGAARNPDWYHNIVANSSVTLDIEGDAMAMRARPAAPDERAVLWPRVVEQHKAFAKQQERTDREFPVVICTPGA